MKPRMKTTFSVGCAALLAGAAWACGPAYSGVPGSPAVTTPAVKGTVFTIIFENHDEAQVVSPSAPYFEKLARENAQAAAYITDVHPSLPNYIIMTSGAKNGVSNDNDPLTNARIPGTDNLFAQLDAQGVAWRFYMESMNTPCRMESDSLYSAHHNPPLYYDYVVGDPKKCASVDVDYDQNFEADLASNRYRYMWITPNMCNDMHDCSPATSSAWLEKVIPMIQASPGYQNDGAIFVVFDEGSMRVLGAAADLPTIVLSPKLVSKSFTSTTRYDHTSYLATVEDIFGMPRAGTTQGSVPMSAFFVPR